MPFSTFRAAAAAALCVIAVASAQSPAVATSGLRPLTYQGCFSSSKPMSDQGSDMYQTEGLCQGICVKLKKAVMGTTAGSNCFCGDQLPALDDKVSDSECNTPCNGFGEHMCMFSLSLILASSTELTDIRRWDEFLVRVPDWHQQCCYQY